MLRVLAAMTLAMVPFMAPVAAERPATAFPQFKRSPAAAPLRAGATSLIDLARDETIHVPGLAAWRPDGLAFISVTRHGVAIHTAAGGSHRISKLRPGAVDWSSGGLIAMALPSHILVVDERGAPVRRVSMRGSPLMQFSPNGSMLLAGSRIVDTRDWRAVVQFDGDGYHLGSWSPDSQKLALMRGGEVLLWRVGAQDVELLDKGWQSESAVWGVPPAWTPDSRAFFVGTGVYNCCSIPSELLVSRVREVVVEDIPETSLLAGEVLETVDLDSPVVSADGRVAARGGSCKRHDLRTQALVHDVPVRLPWPSIVRRSGTEPAATPVWVNGGKWLAYNAFGGISFADPRRGAMAHPNVISNGFIDSIAALPGGRFLVAITEPRNVVPAKNACHGGIAY